ncbi:MAG: hypothetical protein ABEI31_07730 [Halodesulfurarchaeum sp.]
MTARMEKALARMEKALARMEKPLVRMEKPLASMRTVDARIVGGPLAEGMRPLLVV